MKRLFAIALSAALVLVSASCSKSRIEQMQMADKVGIDCTPEVLEIVGGRIPATVKVSCPADYFHPKATMDVTPVLVYEGGEQTLETLHYQGEKVKDNWKVVSAAGSTVTEKLDFKYVKGCEKARLELRGVVHFNGKDYPMDAIKVADGCIATCQLADSRGVYELKPDGYQAFIERQTEGRILYDVNSSTVKKSELDNSSITSFKYNLDRLQKDERVTVKGTQIVAYASPEGGKDYNAALSDKRAGTARSAWDKIAGGMEVSGTEVKSMGQDWEGFQEAVSKSNIEDKDLILRVLSMYSDPAVRESEIRNMSQIYTEINKTVFPELRRARFVTTSEYRNYSDEELSEIAARSLDSLDEPALLHLAANASSDEARETFYKYAVNKFDSDVARYNLAMLYLSQGKDSLGAAYLSKIKTSDSDLLNAAGVCALRDGEYAEAAKKFEAAGSAAGAENIVVLDILKGDYAAAAKAAKGLKGDNAALAHLLAGDLSSASAALEGDGARTNYIRAIIAAREGRNADARALLDKACAADSALKERSLTDIEFARLAN